MHFSCEPESPSRLRNLDLIGIMSSCHRSCFGKPLASILRNASWASVLPWLAALRNHATACASSRATPRPSLYVISAAIWWCCGAAGFRHVICHQRGSQERGKGSPAHGSFSHLFWHLAYGVVIGSCVCLGANETSGSIGSWLQTTKNLRLLCHLRVKTGNSPSDWPNYFSEMV